MQPYEFGAAVQRLSYLAAMVEDTDLQGIEDHLRYAGTVAGLFGTSPQDAVRLKRFQAFVAKAIEFQAECRAVHDELVETDRTVAHARRELAERNPAPSTTMKG